MFAIFVINNLNPFIIKSANTRIKEGIEYNAYKLIAAEFRVSMQELFNSTGHVNSNLVEVEIVDENTYESLVIDAFLSIQSNIEDDSHLKHLDYSFMDIQKMLEYIKTYNMYI